MYRSTTIDYVYHSSFDDQTAVAAIVADMPDLDDYKRQVKQSKVPDHSAPEVAMAFLFPILTREQEQHMFRKMNYYKHLASKADTNSDANLAKAIDIQHFLIQSNYRLVVAYTRNHSYDFDAFKRLLSDGSVVLCKTVVKFDFSRGFKFSTYLTWALIRTIRAGIDDPRSIYVDPNFLDSIVIDTNQDMYGYQPLENPEEVIALLNCLSERERQIIEMKSPPAGKRFGVPMREIAKTMNISVKHCRKIVAQAYGKLREAIVA